MIEDWKALRDALMRLFDAIWYDPLFRLTVLAIYIGLVAVWVFD